MSTDKPRTAAGTRTVRELGGEIWAELSARIPDERLEWTLKGEIAELVMGVLARHAHKVILNDEDLPIEPLPGE